MTRFFLSLVFFLAIDIYFNKRVSSLALAYRKKILVLAWILTAFTISAFAFLYWIISTSRFPVTGFASITLSTIQGIYISKLFSVLFFLIGDLIHLIKAGASKVISDRRKNSIEQTITRSQFLTWTGTIAGAVLFGGLLSGIRNRYRYQVRKLTLAFPNLPMAFDGVTIVHISDIHCGSFDDREAVEKGVSLILELKPDLIVFTGDLVNNRTIEMTGYQEIFGKLKAPLGVYSVLGNHDYGDYVTWESEDLKVKNLQTLKKIQEEMGWRLLLNEHIPITKGHESLGLIGVENWGQGNFAKYGKLEQACMGCEKFPFNVLLTHDPSHWDSEVKDQSVVIDLTLSGHTHGMQFGVDNQFMKWSPVQWFYNQWAGLYADGARKLYVNRGFGFIGYQGRLGIMPEITAITLNRI